VLFEEQKSLVLPRMRQKGTSNCTPQRPDNVTDHSKTKNVHKITQNEVVLLLPVYDFDKKWRNMHQLRLRMYVLVDNP
jgi:hypothetical protein